MAHTIRSKSDLEDIKNTVLEIKQMLTKIIASRSSAPVSQNGNEWRRAKEFCETHDIGSKTTLERRVIEGLVEKNTEMFGPGSPRYRLARKQEETQ